MSEIRLEDLKPEDGYEGEPSQADIMSACERHLGAASGQGVVALVVRDASTNTSTLVVVLTDTEEYKPLPSVLGQIFWKGMESTRATLGVEAFFMRWTVGSDEIEGGPASEDDILVKSVRLRQANENEAVRKALLPPALLNVRRITAAGRQIYQG